MIYHWEYLLLTRNIHYEYKGKNQKIFSNSFRDGLIVKEQEKNKGNVLFQPLNPGRIYGVKNGKNCMPKMQIQKSYTK
jgi:hypothetical protein